MSMNLIHVILHNHDEVYEDRELFHYLKPWILFLWENQKSIRKVHTDCNMVACFFFNKFFKVIIIIIIINLEI